MEFVFVSKRRDLYDPVEEKLLTKDGGEYVLETAGYDGIFDSLSYRCCATDTFATLIRTGRGERYFIVRGFVEEDVVSQLCRFGIPFDRRNITRIK